MYPLRQEERRVLTCRPTFLFGNDQTKTLLQVASGRPQCRLSRKCAKTRLRLGRLTCWLVANGSSAFPAWSRMVPRERGRLLARIADALEARVEELARTIALETGNALRTQARPEAKT